MFAENLATAASVADYERVELPGLGSSDEPEGYRDETTVRGYYDGRSRWPAIAVRLGDEWATIDAIMPEPGTRPLEFQGDKRREYLRSELTDLIEAGGTGRPRAPRPLDTPAFAVSADQRATARFAKMRSYKRLLGRAGRAAVDKRSVALVEGLTRATAVADQWSTAADTLTGASYELHGLPKGSGDRFFRLAMTLYGPTPEAAPALGPVGVGLGVDDRAVGMSLDLDPLFSTAWTDWLAVETLGELGDHADLATDHPALYLLSIPRNFALFLANVETLVEPTIPDALEPLYERRHDLQRLEVATSGGDVGSIRTDPKLVGLLAFDRKAAPEDINVVLQALPSMMTIGFEFLGTSNGARDETFEKASESFTEGELTAFPLPTSHPADPFYYYVHTGEEGAFVFFSHGLAEKAARREVTDILEAKRKPQKGAALFTRLEPAALMNLLTAFDPDALAPLDPGILAQRLGAFELSIRPEKRDGIQMLQYQLDLKKPPDL
ncbi:MAG: hypothetical protein ABEN55_20840 [Bradymonadaceae bacterium]